MGIYEGWFHRNIEQKLSEITDSKECIEFLYDEKRMFVRNNSGDEAQGVIMEFDILIEKESAMAQSTSITKPNTNTNQDEHLHPRYFKKGKFELFEKLVSFIVEERYNLADYSFIFRSMQKDGYIYKYIGESEFRDWLLENYNISINDKLKTLDKCTTERKQRFYSEIVTLLNSILS